MTIKPVEFLFAVLIGLASLLVRPGLAVANPEVKLEWISKGGVAIIPPNSQVTVTDAEIDAETELVLQISLVLDEVAIHEFGFRVTFDDDFRDELDLVADDLPQFPATYGPFDAIATFPSSIDDDSDSEFNGIIGPYRGCTVGSVCDESPEHYGDSPVSDQTIVIGTVTFLPTVNASNDRRDIVIEEVPFNEEFRDADGFLIDHSEITLGYASVVPEPASALLDAAALLTLAQIARVRSRRVA